MLLCALLAAAAAAGSPAKADPPELPSIAPATAAEGFTFDAKRNLGVEFALPGGGAPTVGLTYFVADAVALRLDFGLNATLSPSGTPATFSFLLGLRFYQLKRDRVAVFLEPSLLFGRNLIGAEGAEYIGFGGAVGVEYFFADHLSAGAQLGLLLSLSNLGSNAANASVITQLSTGTSGLFARVYF